MKYLSISIPSIAGFLLFCLPLGVMAQQFTDVTTAMGINVISNSGQQGTGVSFYDIDGDGWDDITFAPNNAPLVIYRNLGGTGFEALSPITNNFETKAPVWVDYDNDGDADLCFTRGQGRTRVFTNNGNWTFTEMPTADFGMATSLMLRSYGQSWGDYDKDGDLDVYICNKTGFNYLGRNNGNGTFTNVTVAAGVGGHPIGPAFQSVWMDYDRDSWPDLFVIYENLPGNANFPNQLFRNNGDGTFTDVAPAAGLNDLTQTMCISPSDFDRDGDQDIYITDVEFEGNQLYRNNGDGTYTDVATAAGVDVNSFCWGGLWIDANLDGYDDLHVATAFTINNNDLFFVNNGDGTFTNTADPLFNNTENGYATAKGDFNNDGHPDFALTKMSLTSGYQLFQANTGTNHYVKIHLEGTHSNRDAIGSWIAVYAAGIKREIYTLAGENYLGQNSQYKLFGLGASNTVDSLVVTWPRGLVEKWYDLQADTIYTFVEGARTQGMFDIPVEIAVCDGDSTVLDPGLWASYLWEDGSTERLFGTSESGLVSVQVSDTNGYSFTWKAEVALLPVPATTISNEHVLCAGTSTGTISVQSDVNSTILWNDENTSFERTEVAAGDYSYTITAANGCLLQGQVTITEPEPLEVSANVEPESCPGSNNGAVLLTAFGGTAPYVFDEQGNTIDGLSPGTYTWEIQDANGCVASIETEIQSATPLEWDVEVSHPLCQGDSTGSIAILDPSSSLEVIWNDGASGLLRVHLPAGEYSYEINYGEGCTTGGAATLLEPASLAVVAVIHHPTCAGSDNGSATLDITGGTAPYTFSSPTDDWSTLPAGTFSGTVSDSNGCSSQVVVTLLAPPALTVAPVIQQPIDSDDTGSVNLNATGGTPPLDILWSNGSTGGSLQGLEEGAYTYTITDNNGCELEGEITIIIDAVSELPDAFFAIYPQPAIDRLTVSANTPVLRWQLMELSGRIINQGNVLGASTFHIDTTPYGGLYVLQMETTNGQWLTKKCIIE